MSVENLDDQKESRPEVLHPELSKDDVEGFLDGLDVEYQIEGGDTEFEITIFTTEEHQIERENLLKKSCLNKPYNTKFDDTKIMPLARYIWGSKNLDCKVHSMVQEGKYIFAVFETKSPKEFRD